MGLQGYVGDASDARKIRGLEAKRAADKEALEKAKAEAEKASSKTALREFGAGESEAAEAAFKAGTVGLVTREQFLATRDRAEAAAKEAAEEQKKKRRRETMSSAGGGAGAGGGGVSAAAAAAAAKRAAARGKLSFGDGDGDGDGDEDDEDDDGDDGEDEEDEEKEEEDAERRGGEASTAAAAAAAHGGDHGPPQPPPQQRRRLAKDPTVRTDFLPDADEEAREATLRAALLEEFEEQRQGGAARGRLFLLGRRGAPAADDRGCWFHYRRLSGQGEVRKFGSCPRYAARSERKEEHNERRKSRPFFPNLPLSSSPSLKKKKQQKLNPGLCSPPSSESSAPPRPRTSST